MHSYYFEKLEVWQNARLLVKEIYQITSTFPTEEKFGITSQIRRASMSIAANIAEGFSRNTEKDKARFLNHSYSSACETINFLILANDLGFISESKLLELRLKTEKITNQLNALHKTICKKIAD